MAERSQVWQMHKQKSSKPLRYSEGSFCNFCSATFATEATDFSGSLPAPDASKTFSQLMTYYSGLPGVQSVTLGYHDVIQLSSDQGASGQGSITINAVDAGTYAHTAIWPASSLARRSARPCASTKIKKSRK
jgi:hypothetical protein